MPIKYQMLPLQDSNVGGLEYVTTFSL